MPSSHFDRRPSHRLLHLIAALSAGLLGISLLSAPAAAQDATTTVPNPVVQGPTENGIRPNPWNASTFPLETDEYSYREDEYVFSGTATFLEDMSTEDFTSRYLIRQPVDAEDFNGTVLVDWMNVTNGQDWEYNWWPTAYDYAMRQGYAIVAVSAQSTGVRHLRTWDPVRYAALDHPGDDYSFDIFAQAMKSLRDGGDNQPADGEVVDPLLGREVKHLIGGGVSQSASRLISFIDGGYTRGVVDAWNIERALGSTPENLETFVFILNEETNFTGAPMAEQAPDSDGLRVWEEAGVSHHAIEWWNYTYAGMQRDLGAPTLDPVDAGCSVNRGTNGYSVRAMLHHTQVYVEEGILPPSAPRIPRLEDGSLPRDEDTLVEGGLRHPFIEVPVAINRQTTQDCINWGTYEPFSDERILELYDTHAEYVRLVAEWSIQQVGRGLLLLEDCEDAIQRAYDFAGPWAELQEAPMPECAAPAEVVRIAGGDRLSTAAAISAHSFPEGATTAVVARADDFPDALAAAPLARSLDAPVLLTRPTSLPDVTAEEITRLGVEEVVVLGGERAVSPDVVASIRQLGPSVRRIADTTRYGTAAAIARDLAPAAGGSAYLASGEAFSDALSVAPLAAFTGSPVLLTPPDRLAAETADLLRAIEVDEVVLVGGEQALSAAVADAVEDLGLSVRRLAGADRFATSAAIHADALAAGMDAESLWLAAASDFPDALAAGPAAAAAASPLALIDGQDLEVSQATTALLDGVRALTIVGGPSAISEEVEAALAAPRAG